MGGVVTLLQGKGDNVLAEKMRKKAEAEEEIHEADVQEKSHSGNSEGIFVDNGDKGCDVYDSNIDIHERNVRREEGDQGSVIMGKRSSESEDNPTHTFTSEFGTQDGDPANFECRKDSQRALSSKSRKIDSFDAFDPKSRDSEVDGICAYYANNYTGNSG